MSKSDDNLNALYYYSIDSKYSCWPCGYFKFWIPSPNYFNNGAIFHIKTQLNF